MKKVWSILCGLVLCAVVFTAQGSDYTIQHYTVENGLSQNTVMSILQDKDGYMWFGTWDGLNKFDGYTFTTYKSRPNDGQAMRSNRIDFLYEDALGYIWLQTYDGKIYRFDKQTETFADLECTADKLRRGAQYYFAEPRPGEMWFATNQGAVQVMPHTVNPIVYGSAATPFVLADEGGNVWYASQDTLCWVSSDGKQFTAYGTPKGVQYASAAACKTAIWFGTTNGIVVRYSPQQKVFENISLHRNTTITDLQKIDTYNLMLTTSSAGFFIYNSETASLQQYASHNTPAIRSNNFLSITRDNAGILWLENEQSGIFRYRLQDKSLKHLQSDIDVRFAGQLRPNLFFVDNFDNRLWINPSGGGFAAYNPEKDVLENALPGLTNMIHAAYVDQQGSLWVSTYGKGLDRVDILRNQFYMYQLEHAATEESEVRALLERANGDVLIACKDGRVHYLNSTLQEQTQLPVRELVYTMHEDKEGNVWLGTRGSGLLRARQQGKQWQIKQYKHTADPYSLSCDEVYDITEDAAGNLYIGTYGGGVNMMKGNRFYHSGNDAKYLSMEPASKVRNLLIVGETLYAATTGGLLQVDLHTKTSFFTSYYDIHSLLLSQDSTIWLGTFGGGLNKLTHAATADSVAQFKPYTVLNGMHSDIVLTMIEDENGKLWLVSENVITQFDPEQETFQYFNVFAPMEKHYFTEAQAISLQSGQALVGYNAGYCGFLPERIIHDNNTPHLMLTGFQLFNTDVVIGGKDSPLEKSISETDEITLESGQSVFSIEYAALDFVAAERIQYAFMLEGFETTWNYVQQQRKATYTNLKPGTYRFCVRSTNAAGVWVDNLRTLTIKVLPSFWQTGWAACIYVLLILVAIFIATRVILSYSRLRQEVEVEQKVTDIKLRFFTNISHELRTPLTLITGPVENVLQTENLSSDARTQLEIVQNNGKRMLHLINEILDFRKIQNQKMRLRVQNTPLWPIVQTTCGNFTKEAYDKHINFSLHNDAPETCVWIDHDKVDMILYNLLSNAFKFTPAGKSISVTIAEKPNFVLLKVSDTGVGIPDDKRDVLFERFTSHNEIKSFGSTPGTGIGLNLVKELVDLHKGYIEVESEVGQGTTFTVMFRKGKAHFDNNVEFLRNTAEPITDSYPHDGTHILNPSEHGEKHSLLVVEDNGDMRSFLCNIFREDFNVTMASDGVEGMQKAKEVVPDIIISDLMMPNMDGLEMTTQLKKDESTSHVPIILLTAKSAIESRLEALHEGADDYITKPFSPEYLRARVDNILTQRKRLQERYRASLLNLQPKQPQQKFPNEVFLAKLLDFMERNMDNNNLIVEDLVNEMALGRTVFFNKLKSLTGLSPVEFIRDVRIKRAAQLLSQGTYNVTEVTYMVGMNDSRYFSKCFKLVYGMSPSEYKKSLGKGNA